VAQLVAPLVSIHVVGLTDPYGLPYEPASFVGFSINHLGVLQIYHMILIANIICDCRFVADTGCPGLSALVKIPVMLSTSLRCSFTFAPSGLQVSLTEKRPVHSFYMVSYKPLYDEGFRREAEMLINSMLIWLY